MRHDGSVACAASSMSTFGNLSPGPFPPAPEHASSTGPLPAPLSVQRTTEAPRSTAARRCRRSASAARRRSKT